MCTIFVVFCMIMSMNSAENPAQIVEAKSEEGKSVVDLYKYKGDTQFVPISQQFIKNSSSDVMEMTQFVHLKTGVIYLYTERHETGVYAEGIGTTWTMLVDVEGNPLVYENIEELRKTLQ